MHRAVVINGMRRDNAFSYTFGVEDQQINDHRPRSRYFPIFPRILQPTVNVFSLHRFKYLRTRRWRERLLGLAALSIIGTVAFSAGLNVADAS